MYDGEEVAGRMDVWKMENMFLLLAYLVCTVFVKGYQRVVCPLEVGHFLRGRLVLPTSIHMSRPTSINQCVGNHKPPEATVMGKKETLLHERHTPINTLIIFDPTLFQRTKVFCSRWGRRRGRQIGGVFNCKRQKEREEKRNNGAV